MIKNNEERDEALARRFEGMFKQAFGNIQQANEARFQQEATKLETMMEGKLEGLATEVSARLTAHQEDINEQFVRIVNKNQEMNEDLRKGLQEVGERVTTIESNKFDIDKYLK